MLHIYASVSNVFIRMLQVVSSECLQWLDTWFSSFSGVSQVFQTYVANVSTVSDVYCKCFL
jgi:hypothetical protein